MIRFSTLRDRLLAWASVFGAVACGRVEVSVVTYNVAGLPEGVSASHPSRNSERMGRLLNDFDVVLVQEDFAYHNLLSSGAAHAYREPAPGDDERLQFNASGLARFSSLPMRGYQRFVWHSCHGTTGYGSDCFAAKGFSIAKHHVKLEGLLVEIDVYNLHMDAGRGPDDDEARKLQTQQLLEAIEARSATAAVIVAGDTNVEQVGQGPLLALSEAAGLIDACAELRCPGANRVDRVLYRSSTFVKLEPLRWRIAQGFVDEDGLPLSDHEPVAVDFAVSAASYEPVEPSR